MSDAIERALAALVDIPAVTYPEHGDMLTFPMAALERWHITGSPDGTGIAAALLAHSIGWRMDDPDSGRRITVSCYDEIGAPLCMDQLHTAFTMAAKLTWLDDYAPAMHASASALMALAGLRDHRNTAVDRPLALALPNCTWTWIAKDTLLAIRCDPTTVYVVKRVRW